MIIANTFNPISQAEGFVSKMPLGAVSICMPISRRSLIGRLNVSSNPEFSCDGGKKKLDRSPILGSEFEITNDTYFHVSASEYKVKESLSCTARSAWSINCKSISKCFANCCVISGTSNFFRLIYRTYVRALWKCYRAWFYHTTLMGLNDFILVFDIDDFAGFFCLEGWNRTPILLE